MRMTDVVARVATGLGGSMLFVREGTSSRRTRAFQDRYTVRWVVGSVHFIFPDTAYMSR